MANEDTLSITKMKEQGRIVDSLPYRMVPQLVDSRPLDGLHQPNDNDIVCGRGSAANRHIGNSNFRALIRCNKALYVRLTKRDKMAMAREILHAISTQNPRGRFLQKDSETSLWYDIGTSRSLEKISQALREKTNWVSHENRVGVSKLVDDFSVQYDSIEKTSGQKYPQSPHSIERPSFDGIVIPTHLMSKYRKQKNFDCASSAMQFLAPTMRDCPVTMFPTVSPRLVSWDDYGHSSVPSNSVHTFPSPHRAYPLQYLYPPKLGAPQERNDQPEQSRGEHVCVQHPTGHWLHGIMTSDRQGNIPRHHSQHVPPPTAARYCHTLHCPAQISTTSHKPELSFDEPDSKRPRTCSNDSLSTSLSTITNSPRIEMNVVSLNSTEKPSECLHGLEALSQAASFLMEQINF